MVEYVECFQLKVQCPPLRPEVEPPRQTHVPIVDAGTIESIDAEVAPIGRFQSARRTRHSRARELLRQRAVGGVRTASRPDPPQRCALTRRAGEVLAIDCTEAGAIRWAGR